MLLKFRAILAGVLFSTVLLTGTGAAVPTVKINQQTASLQATLYPDYYAVNAVGDDIRWVFRNSDPVQSFWQANRDSILSSLANLSGITWTETEFEIYLVRFYPSVGEGQPTIIPIGGIRTGVLTEAVPSGVEMQFNIIYQLAVRMLAQTDQAGNAAAPIADHPLMDPTPFRRDNLAMCLATAVAGHILGAVPTDSVYRSAFWTRHHVGRIIYEELFQKNWVLTRERPLLNWIGAEPPRSSLVISTEPPGMSDFQGVSIGGVPLKGQLGFSTKLTTAGRLEIDRIDGARLGYAAGLRQGDVINLVDGARVRSTREMVEAVLAGLARGGSSLQVLRDGKTQTIVLQPRRSGVGSPTGKL